MLTRVNSIEVLADHDGDGRRVVSLNEVSMEKMLV